MGTNQDSLFPRKIETAAYHENRAAIMKTDIALTQKDNDHLIPLVLSIMNWSPEAGRKIKEWKSVLSCI
jgi:hypothetical protein